MVKDAVIPGDHFSNRWYRLHFPPAFGKTRQAFHTLFNFSRLFFGSGGIVPPDVIPDFQKILQGERCPPEPAFHLKTLQNL